MRTYAPTNMVAPVPSWDTTRKLMYNGPSFSFTLAAIDPLKVVSVVAWIMFVLWLVYTIVASYHWLRYGHRSSVAIPAIITHLVVSGALALFAISGFAPA